MDQSLRDSRVKRNKNLADVLTEAKNYMDKKTEEKIEFWSSKGKPVRWPKIFVVLRMYWKVRRPLLVWNIHLAREVTTIESFGSDILIRKGDLAL